MTARLAALAGTVLLATGCAGSGAAGPVAIDLGHDACSHCRMAIISTATAAEIVAPGEEPRLFDDLGCLRDFIAAAPLAADAVVFVADHRTGAWVNARHASFTKTSVQTPMGSGLVAHADTASRDQDPAARGGTAVSTGSILR
jgi:copper chaperone NosL